MINPLRMKQKANNCKFNFIEVIVNQEYSSYDLYTINCNALQLWVGRKTRVHQTAGMTPAIF